MYRGDISITDRSITDLKNLIHLVEGKKGARPYQNKKEPSQKVRIHRTVNTYTNELAILEEYKRGVSTKFVLTKTKVFS